MPVDGPSFQKGAKDCTGWRREVGRTFIKKERGERPSAYNLLHILPFWPLQRLPKELCKILSNPNSSTSTRKAAALTETWPAAEAKNKKKYISTS